MISPVGAVREPPLQHLIQFVNYRHRLRSQLIISVQSGGRVSLRFTALQAGLGAAGEVVVDAVLT